MASRKAAAESQETAVVVAERYDDETLRAITSFDEAMAQALATYGTVESITENLGNGFRVMTESEKARLVGVSFVILQFDFTMGDFGEFVSMALVTRNNDRLIMNDGSTGIYYQALELAKKRKGGWGVPHGLRVSEYDTCPPQDGGCGRPRRSNVEECPVCKNTSTQRGKGATYYLDTSE